MATKKEQSRSHALASKAIFAALSILKDNGGVMPTKDLYAGIEKRVTFDEWESKPSEKTGGKRWVTNLRLFSIDFVKAGFIEKKEGHWYLTAEGESALTLGPRALLDEATRRYREWELTNQKTPNKKVLENNSIRIKVQGQQFTFSTEDVIKSFSETTEADWRDNPGRDAYSHVIVDNESKPIKAVFRKLPGVPVGFNFNTNDAKRAFKGLGFAIRDTRIVDAAKQLSLIGTWKEVVDEHESVEQAIKHRGGWASWWSFPIEEEAQDLLTAPFYIYLNSGGGVFPYRMKVEEYQASRGNNGIQSPWPSLTDENCRDNTRAGDKQSEVFKTWLKISEIEELDPPMTLDDMTMVEICFQLLI